MSDLGINPDRLLDLAGAVCNRIASEDDCVELNSLLLADGDSRNRYVDYCWIHVALRLQLRARRAAQRAHRQINFDPAVAVSDKSSAVTIETRSAVPLGFVATAFHGASGYVSEGMPLAYLIATVIFGVGLLIGRARPRIESGTGRPTIRPSPLSPLPSPLSRGTDYGNG